MLRLVELALLLAPIGAFLVWRLLGPEDGPSPRMLAVAAGVLVVLAGVLYWLSQEEALPPGTAYEPPKLQDGQIVPAHGAHQ